MKKYAKFLLLVNLLLTLYHPKVVADARTLEESRAAVIDVLTQGLSEQFTYEEAEDYFYNDLQWDRESEDVMEFMAIIARFFR